ncbi:MAG: glutathione S-transferase family protein [Caulobacterales bacterium]
MSKDLVFYTNPQSRGRIVRWMLEEVGQPYRTEILDYASTLKGPEYLAINPMGKIPALKHGDTVVTEGAAICAYLADAFPEAGLAPALADRGDYYRWLFFTAGPLEQAWTYKSFGFEPTGDERRRAGFGTLEDVVNALELTLKDRDYLAGGRFSAADVFAAAGLGFGMQFGMLPKLPAFERYVGKHFARPAAVRAREIDDALIAQPQPA